MRTTAGFLSCAFFAAILYPASTIADQVAIDASKDNTLFESNEGSLSNGVGQYLFSGLTGEELLRRAVIAFDIAAHVPAGAQITAATLQLNVSLQQSGTHTSTLHRLTQDWGEGNSNSNVQGGGRGAPAAANDATWLHTFFSASMWTAAGGDFVPQGSASTSISGNGLAVWASTATMVTDVQGWLDAPATNFGWIIRTDEATFRSAKRFDSRQHNSPANHPVLVVVYEGTSVQPATWSITKALFR
jgi:hypothetical protein